MKKLFFIIIFVLTLFVFKNNGFGNTQLDCPGLKNFKSWCGGEQIENEKKSCFMVSIPDKEEGKYTKRGKTSVTIYHIPKEQSIGIVYVTAGYKFKEQSSVNIHVDTSHSFEFKLIEEDTAWLDEEALEKKLIEKMKSGTNMKVVGYSARGTKTTDTYSLMGFTNAYNYISQLCDIKLNK